ncbi:hypothetical protein CLU97_1511 [Chryseobacterium sp. 7]|uniref:hypothetical protein n=1 Tax=Chryseobacterium sp. 7 TaxID=2035214 RepID=UPI000EB1C495|nr:hypothetical protein [Chryseobacterium sp. 7]RLJ32068.1 hypothetical protein CLU97_1511 [Chryseobacterium sp. 7]
MKKLVTTFKVFAVLSVLALQSCRDENNEMNQQETTQAKITADDLKKEIIPLPSKVVPDAVQLQLNESQKNLETYLKNDLQIAGVAVLGKITPKGIELSKSLITDKDQYIASGNIMDPSSVKIGKIGDLYTGEDLTTAQQGLKDAITEEVKSDTNVMEITWNSKDGKFTTVCFYNDSGIIWDNIFGGLVMMDTRGNSEASNNQAAKVVSTWYKQWWTANWLWGSKRGEAGYQITIYYSGSTVSNADVSDWGYISLGKAKSESKITKKTGAYGQCRYALGMCTPTGSLSFNSSNFTVSFSGLGSNIVSNGTKSLYP